MFHVAAFAHRLQSAKAAGHLGLVVLCCLALNMDPEPCIAVSQGFRC